MTFRPRSASSLSAFLPFFVFCLVLPAARAAGPGVQPADADLSGSIDRSEVQAFEARWRGGEQNLQDALTQASFLEQNGGCYVYDPALPGFRIRACEPVVSAPTVAFFRENPVERTVTAPIVQFAREIPKDLKVTAPIVQFARENPKPPKATAPIVHFAREAP